MSSVIVEKMGLSKRLLFVGFYTDIEKFNYVSHRVGDLKSNENRNVKAFSLYYLLEQVN